MLGEILNNILLTERISSHDLDYAMDNHKYIAFNYNSTRGQGINTGRRYVIPFAYGVTKSGNPVLRAFQLKGDTTSDNFRWKFFRLDRIEHLTVSKREFTQEDLEQYWQFGEINYNGDDSMAGTPEKIISFRSNNSVKPVQNDTSGPINSKGQVMGSTPSTSADMSNQSGPKMQQQKVYKPGDVIPYKEFMRRNVDLRFGGRKSNLTKLANDLFKAGALNNNDEEPQNVQEPEEETPNLGQVAGWKDDTITAKDQVNQRMSGLEQQLQNGPKKIDLSQFDKYEPTTNKKRW